MAFTITEDDFTISQRKGLKYKGSKLDPPINTIKNTILYYARLQGDKGFSDKERDMDISLLTDVKSAEDATTVGTVKAAVIAKFPNGD